MRLTRDSDGNFKIIIEPGDPKGPEFDPQELEEAGKRLRREVQEIEKQAKAYYKAIEARLAQIYDLIQNNPSCFEFLEGKTQDVQELAPFVLMVLKDFGKSFQEVLESGTDADGNHTGDPKETPFRQIVEQGIDATGQPTDSQFRTLIERAKLIQADFAQLANVGESESQTTEALPRIIANPTDLLTYPLDKPNSKIWNLLAAAGPNGQLTREIDTTTDSDKKKGIEAIIYCGISFDELETGIKITKTLTPFDKRVYIAADALFNGGNEIISLTQIYKMMGNSGQPTTKQIQRINDSLTKMGAARIYLDNEKEVNVYKKYTRFKYDAALLPFERISAYINNTLTESAIHLFREPPLITFARERKQIIDIPRQLLESPLNKTDPNLILEDYLLVRIGRMRSRKSNAPRKMLFSTIYERCNIKTKKQQQRAPEKIEKYLLHYKKCGWIAGYTMDKDGVTIQIKPVKKSPQSADE